MTNCDVTILGAGPYGLAAGAHLQQVRGLDVRIFGEPMWFWKNRMPTGMLLRSSWEASHIADPKSALTLDAYRMVSGNHVSSPVSLERFIDYGLWFQRNAIPNLDQRKIATIELDLHNFRLTLADGEVFKSRRVVIAGGICPFAWRPPEFANLPSELASHSSEHQDLSRFAGKKVLVIGGGQGALESGALLHEGSADVEIMVRATQINWLGWKKRIKNWGPIYNILYSWSDVGPAGISRIVSIPDLLMKFPRHFQDRLRRRSIRPGGAAWLPARLRGVPVLTGKFVVSAAPFGGRVRLILNDRTERVVDHVLLGTGYRMDITRYGFITPDILHRLQCSGGFPKLVSGFESSVSGLHFLGAPAAWTYGPLMYFVAGTKYAARTLTRHIFTGKGSA
jgi:hypothetical protein